jgi:hypothetical protein
LLTPTGYLADTLPKDIMLNQNDLNSTTNRSKAQSVEQAASFKQQADQEVDYKTRKEIASKYRISLPTLHKHTLDGMPSFKVGKRRLYNPVDVAEYIAAKNKK